MMASMTDREFTPTARFPEAVRRIEAMIGDDLTRDPVAIMATASAVLRQEFPHFHWVGFYRVAGCGELRVGPYQGPPGCLRIAFGSGVVGTCAVERRARLVPDVTKEANHIACDPDSRCEAVAPVLSPAGDLLAVLDVDTRTVGELTDEDVAGLLAVADAVGRAWVG